MTVRNESWRPTRFQSRCSLRAGHDLGRDLRQAKIQDGHHPGRQQQPRDDDEAELRHAPGADDYRDNDQTKNCSGAKRDGAK